MTTPAKAPGRRPAAETCAFIQRALLVWPRLDRRTLARCGCDPRRIAAYVARRTSLPVEVITAILEANGRGDREPSFSFG